MILILIKNIKAFFKITISGIVFNMKKVKVFVSGCYDIIHAGHIQFFKDAKALGNHLTVCFASAPVLELVKNRKSSMPDDNKREIISSLVHVDEVVMSSDFDPVFDFRSHIETIKPHIIATTEDDKNIEAKKIFCKEKGIKLVVLPKRNSATQVSTTSVLASIKNLDELPLRVDFAGGWLDVPSFSTKGGFVVNCAITPKVSLSSWPYEKGAGLGGSAAYALLQAKHGVKSEVSSGMGWQDPAVISETGLCVWRSGEKPILDIKVNPDWLSGKMLAVWSGNRSGFYNTTPRIASLKRDYKLIKQAGALARKAVYAFSLLKLAKAISMSYKAQIKEGMRELPSIKNSIARKYLGAGHGGYILYLFKSKKLRDCAHKKIPKSICIEPYIEIPK